MREAEGLASRVLYADQSRGSSSAPTIRHDHFHWGYSSWGYFPQPIYCYGPSDVRGRFEKKDYSWVAIPATIIALGTLYFIGQNHADWLQAKGEIEQLRQTNRAVRIELSQENPVLKSTVLSIFQKQMGILEALQKNAINGLLLKGILLISVILAGVGGLASGGILFTAGLEPFLEYGSITAFIAVAAMLYRSGFSSMDTSIQGKAKELLIAVERAEQILYPPSA